MANMPYLARVSLAGNQLTGTIPAQMASSVLQASCACTAIELRNCIVYLYPCGLAQVYVDTTNHFWCGVCHSHDHGPIAC